MTSEAEPSNIDGDARTPAPDERRVRRLPGLAVAAIASVAAGVIHAGAIGIHAEHPQTARVFVVVAVLQLGVGLAAFARPHRLVALAVVGVNAVAVAGWVATRIAGIPWIDGLEVREAPQFADTACALFGAIAIGAALAAVLSGWHEARPARILLPSLAAIALTIPAMMAGASHVHAHDATAADHAHTDAASPAADASGGAAGATSGTVHTHDEATSTDSSVDPGTTATTVHSHDTTAVSSSAAGATWPRPWDPTQPIDISGVAGVSPEQEARALALIEGSLAELPKYSDTAAAIADGYSSIGDAGTGSEHYIKASLIQDDALLDPTQPESLVYTVKGDQRILAGAMYIASARPTDDPELVNWAGPLMQWHNHGDLCWDRDANGVPKVVGLVDASGKCARGVNTGGASPMVHVWITAHECGVFSALEGIGAGQTAVPEDQRVDKCQPTHDHGATATVAPVPYDPTKPIDLGGVPGVTPEQQAAAENLVAVTLVRLPKWSDYKTAEAAGFHSIGDGLTGHEHYVQWDWINDDIVLDPDHPESLVYAPQPDGTKQLVSAMYMLPDTIDLAHAPDLGGALTQWHIHNNLCYTTGDAPRVAGLTDGNGNCPASLVKKNPAAMIHVWIVPQKCGPFAALDGVGAGQIADGQTRLCDTAHGGA
jgi:hypothetical protein